MSDNWIVVVPEDPFFVPSEDRQEAARSWFEEFAPRADAIELNVSDQIQFHDCGSNLERIMCPSCGEEIRLGWWQRGFHAIQVPDVVLW